VAALIGFEQSMNLVLLAVRQAGFVGIEHQAYGLEPTVLARADWSQGGRRRER
jgi:hypothetical protein